jgi:hypothetical protein
MARNPNVRFVYNNFALVADASITVSSTASGYSKANIKNARRSHVWRSGGNFTITSSNCKIYIDDGSEKTVTLTTGNYTYSTLATHVQTQLNASSSSWTCTYDFNGETFKFTIGHTGSATLRLSQTTDAAWSTLGYTGSSDDTGTSWIADEQRNHTEETIEWDLGSAKAVGFFGLVGRSDEISPFSSSATVTLEANSSSSWASAPLSRTLTVTDEGIFEWLDDLEEASRTYRYWRLKFVDKTNPQGPEGFDLSYISIADYVTFTARTMSTGFTKSKVDPSQVSEADSGARFFRKRTKYVRYGGVNIKFLDESDREDFETMYSNVGITEPLFFSVDPLLNISSVTNQLTALVRFDSEPEFQHVLRDLFDVSMSFTEVI